jgi:hypothetical protein
VRPAIILALLVLSLSFAQALTFDLPKTNYFKGEVIALSGDCGPGEVFDMAIYWQGIVLATDTIVCPNTGRYQYTHPITFEYPSGQWRLVVGSFFQNINVNPSPESQLLDVKFFGPSKEVFRNQEFKIAVTVNESDRRVTDAKVIAWDSFGGKYALEHEGQGNYEAKAALPFDAQLGNLALTVVAVSADGASGGQAAHSSRISQAKINAVIVTPDEDAFEAAQEIPFQITLEYENGQPLSEPIVVIVGDDVNYFPRKLDPKNFIMEFLPTIDLEGEVPLKVMVFDSADNSLVKEWNIVIHRGFFWYSKKYGALLLAFVIILTMIYFVAGKRVAASTKASTTKENIRRHEAAIRKLQKQFFDGKIDRKTFKSESFKLEQKIAKLKKGLKA